MYVFLPRGLTDPEEFLCGLNEENWERWIKGFCNEEIDITLPRFKIENKINFNEILKSIGIKKAFDTGKNDLSEIFSIDKDTFISQISQKTFIEVNEEGAEAVAVTIEETCEGVPAWIEINHPFFFAITENTTGTILFMGTVIEPFE